MSKLSIAKYLFPYLKQNIQIVWVGMHYKYWYCIKHKYKEIEVEHCRVKLWRKLIKVNTDLILLRKFSPVSDVKVKECTFMQDIQNLIKLCCTVDSG